MKDLRKEMHFVEGQSTTTREIEKLANDLLDLTWTIDIYRHKEASIINLRDLGWKFEFNTRKRAAGLCSYRKKTIFISKWLLTQNLDRALNFENTIRHELAHALDGAMGQRSHHNHIWKAIARKVLCNAERCYSSDEISVNETTKYTLICDNCEKKIPSHKVKKVNSACGECCNNYNGGKYSQKYVLRQVQNY